VDFTDLKRVVRGIIAGIDHQFLNDLEPFRTVNPSAENLARFFYEQTRRGLSDLPDGAGITEVIVWETDTSSATYRPEAAGKQ
jgi:6-pyruvoyltetrahydropterin/6-carboxytetrahydropterin synthase